MDAMLNEMIQRIDGSIKSWGGDYGACYVGITDNPKQRLYEQHRVETKDPRTVCVDAGNVFRAREIEDYFLKLGTAGGGGGGTTESIFVCAYYMTESTEP